ncbi:MAG: trypsin-like peptidase domain-containing protein [Myxococcaceae bacterium]
MNAPSRDVALALTAQARSALVRIVAGKNEGTGFIATPEGRIVTNLHLVAGASRIDITLSDGRTIAPTHLAAMDERRSLVVLQVETTGLPSLPCHPPGTLTPGDQLWGLGAGPHQEALLFEVRLEAVRILGNQASLYTLAGSAPPLASGGPLLTWNGDLAGVLAFAEASKRPAPLGIPYRYLAPLLESPGCLPLDSLQQQVGPRRRRAVPQLSDTLLANCPTKSVSAFAQVLQEAITEGAPLYNRGDAHGCFQVYLQAAERLLFERRDCFGLLRAIAEGVGRARGFDEADARAWALRDAFDGVLALIQQRSEASATDERATQRLH